MDDCNEELIDRSRDGRVGLVGRPGGAKDFASLGAVDDKELPAGAVFAIVQQEGGFDAAWQHGVDDEFVFEPKGSAFPGSSDQVSNELGRVDGNIGARVRGRGHGRAASVKSGFLGTAELYSGEESASRCGRVEMLKAAASACCCGDGLAAWLSGPLGADVRAALACGFTVDTVGYRGPIVVIRGVIYGSGL